MKVKVITDSTSYMAKEDLERYDIRLVSLSVTIDGENIRELDIDNDTFYERMARAAEIPTSSQPAVAEMYAAFEQVILAGCAVAAVFISSKMSGTYDTGVMVRQQILEKYPDAQIAVVDSTSNCMQLGYVALEGAKAAAEGKSLPEVLAVMDWVIGHSRFLFTPQVLDYLRKGGRIGGAAALVGTLLQIKPILTVENGETTVFAKVRTKKKAIETIVDSILAEIGDHEIGGMTVVNIHCVAEGQELINALEAKCRVPVTMQHLGPIIGVHVGPGAIGVISWWW